MDSDYKKLLSNLPEITPPEGLFDLVIAQIIKQKRRRLVWQVSGWSVGLLFSLLGLWWVIPATWQQMGSSGLGQFISLLFSDFSVVVQYWRSFVWSILESLPALSLSVTLALLWLSFGLINRLNQDLKILLTKKLYGFE